MVVVATKCSTNKRSVRVNEGREGGGGLVNQYSTGTEGRGWK